ncbi:protein FRG2-like-1 [Tupaia chinensis]|uniref:protein FRG2-like-1 n=1 Tax=Tupaia chinensis TaxID=246437 RepID=UPI000704498D|nr:protein FRG2-like-1 [Tupaia chinensis]
MGLGTQDPDSHCTSSQGPTDQPPLPQVVLEESGSGNEEKPLDEEISSGSESESSSDEGRSRKRKASSGDSCQAQPGNYEPGDEDGETLEKKRKPSVGLDGRSSSEGQPTRGAHSSGPLRAGSGRPNQPRSRSPGGRPPPLRKSLVTSLRTLSEAIYQDMAQVWAQQAHTPLTEEQLAELAQLRGPLHAAVQTFYAMARQAACTFPAEGWFLPAPALPSEVPSSGPEEDRPPTPCQDAR